MELLSIDIEKVAGTTGLMGEDKEITFGHDKFEASI